MMGWVIGILYMVIYDGKNIMAFGAVRGESIYPRQGVCQLIIAYRLSTWVSTTGLIVIQPLPRPLRRGLVGRRLALHSNVPLDALADDDRRATSGASQVDIRQVNARAHRVGRADQIGHDLALLAGRSTVDVLKGDVGDVHARWELRALRRLDVEVALIQHYRLVGVLNVDVLVRDVVDSAVADPLTGPRLEASSVLACASVRGRLGGVGMCLPVRSAGSRSQSTRVR